MQTCPLCAAADTRHFHRDRRRDYWRCARCALVFVPAEQRLDAREERAVYDQHENSPEDPGYRRFLSRLYDPLRERLAPGARGLDFGAGPGPTLSVMFEEAGYPMAIYDPFYAPDASVLEQTYDFITASEVVEHLFAPGEELTRLAGLLRPGGWLGLMTCFQTDDAQFADWQYRKDPTHVVFYRAETMAHIAAARGWSCTIPCKDVALMQVPAP